MPSHAFIRLEHKFFDDSVGDISFGRKDTEDLPIPVELNIGFGEIEIDRTPVVSLFRKNKTQLLHCFKQRDEFSVAVSFF